MKLNQEDIIEFLKNNESAYTHHVSEIQLKETHISWILLTGKFAYKIKKAVKLGSILNFSTLSLRRKYCVNEVAINKPLCGNMYLGVMKIIFQNDGYKITPIEEPGKALDYAVQMTEIPQKYRLDRLLIENKVTPSMITNLAKKLASFHKSTPTNIKIQRQGDPRQIQKKLDEDFETLSELARISPLYKKKMTTFLKENRKFFQNRVRDKKIRDLHGDLYLKNIFITTKRTYLYDRIEFNDILRYGDVAEDLGFLSMDLDFVGKKNIRKDLVKKYVHYSNDQDLCRILPFYMSHKACIRAKVNFFFAKNTMDITVKKSHLKTAKKFLSLVKSYFVYF